MYRFSPAPWLLKVRPGTELAKSVKSLTPIASSCAEPIAVMAVGMDCAVSSPRLRAVTRTSDKPEPSAAAGLSAATAVCVVPAMAQATANETDAYRLLEKIMCSAPRLNHELYCACGFSTTKKVGRPY